jgi:hypothetical protein
VANVTAGATVGASGMQDVTQILLAAAIESRAALEPPRPELLSTVLELGERQLCVRDLIGSPRPLRPKDTTLQAARVASALVEGFLTTDVDVAAGTTATATVSGALAAGTIADDFTGADSDPGTLTGTGTWTQVVGTSWKNLTNMAVVENGPVWGTVLVRRSGDLGANSFDLTGLIGDWTSLTATDMWLGLGVFNDTATTGYGAHVSKDPNSEVCKVTLWKIVAGAFTSLTTAVVVPAPTPGSSVLRVRRLAGTGVLTAFYEGQQVAEATNSDITVDTTRVGLWAGMGPRSGTVRVGFDSISADVAA